MNTCPRPLCHPAGSQHQEHSQLFMGTRHTPIATYTTLSVPATTQDSDEGEEDNRQSPHGGWEVDHRDGKECERAWVSQNAHVVANVKVESAIAIAGASRHRCSRRASNTKKRINAAAHSQCVCLPCSRSSIIFFLGGKQVQWGRRVAQHPICAQEPCWHMCVTHSMHLTRLLV
jgi:hypothetical protein